MQRLAGKVAIVTGAGTGIGQAIATRLGAEGTKVIVDYIGDPAGAEQTLSAIERAGGIGEIVQADITRISDIHDLLDTAWQHFGSADILVNNAGVSTRPTSGTRLRTITIACST